MKQIIEKTLTITTVKMAVALLSKWQIIIIVIIIKIY